jgi:hypothetical protein
MLRVLAGKGNVGVRRIDVGYSKRPRSKKTIAA